MAFSASPLARAANWASVQPVVFNQSWTSHSARCSSVSLRARLFVRLAGATEPFGEALGEIRRAQPPAAPEGVPLARGFALAPALFQALLEMDAIPGGVGLDAVRAQETIHPEPRRARGGRQVVGETAPRIGRKRLVGREEAGADGVEMHVIAGGPEVVAAAFVDDEGFVASAEEVAEELMRRLKRLV